MARKKAPSGTASPRRSAAVSVAPEERERMVAIAAYYRAERRSFAPGDELRDWLEAETEVEGLLAAPKRKAPVKRAVASPSKPAAEPKARLPAEPKAKAARKRKTAI